MTCGIANSSNSYAHAANISVFNSCVKRRARLRSSNGLTTFGEYHFDLCVYVAVSSMPFMIADTPNDVSILNLLKSSRSQYLLFGCESSTHSTATTIRWLAGVESRQLDRVL